MKLQLDLFLGCLRMVAGRLGLEIIPLYVESNFHYYRTYVKVHKRPDQEENLGYITHCKNCGHRKIVFEKINFIVNYVNPK